MIGVFEVRRTISRQQLYELQLLNIFIWRRCRKDYITIHLRIVIKSSPRCRQIKMQKLLSRKLLFLLGVQLSKGRPKKIKSIKRLSDFTLNGRCFQGKKTNLSFIVAFIVCNICWISIQYRQDGRISFFSYGIFISCREVCVSLWPCGISVIYRFWFRGTDELGFSPKDPVCSNQCHI